MNNIKDLSKCLADLGEGITDAIETYDAIVYDYNLLRDAAEDVDQYDFSEDQLQAEKAGTPTDAYLALRHLTYVLKQLRMR